MGKILVIEDNQTMREGISTALGALGHTVWETGLGAEGVALFKAQPIDVVISDLKMEPMDGFAVLTEIKKIDPEALVMIITAFGEIETAVEAMQLGATDFLTKPFEIDVLEVKVDKALDLARLKSQKTRLENENAYLRQEESRRFDTSAIVGRSGPMDEIFRTLEKIAPTDSSVMILGESGTGKELMAHAIHERSLRSNGPFIKVHCGALAEGVLESELFGHEKGSFTGALRRKIGRFELADGGTLFLDEIGDLSPLIQQKLLRVLQERQFERVGGDATLEVDIRLITATNKNMMLEVKENRFREDLYYRLHVVPLRLPPLRDRKSDISLLVDHFIEKLRGRTRSKAVSVDAEALARLAAHDWPGNIRELENAVEQSLVMGDGERIRLEHLPPWLRAGGGDSAAQSNAIPAVSPASEETDEERTLPQLMEDYEKRLIERAIEKSGGSKTEIARLLGIKTSALYYKLDKYSLNVDGGADRAAGDEVEERL